MQNLYTPAYYESQREDIQTLIPLEAQRILDVGCGAGKLGQSIKANRPVEVVGIELNPEAAKIAQQCLDRVLQGSIEASDLDLPASYFDVIIFADILEHLSDPWQVLSHFTTYLKPQGKIVASIPNASFYLVPLNLLRGRWRYTDRGVLDKTHLRFFTLETIQMLFAQAGLTIETMTRNCRLRDRDRRYSRLAQWLAIGPWAHLLTYQYRLVATRTNEYKPN